jgi:hypothetical protein
MKSFYKLILCFFALGIHQSVLGQDTLRIENILKVSKGEKLEIKAGTVVLFSPGARIWVEGSLSINGTKDKNVILTSLSKEDPGTGVFVNGIDLQGNILIQNAVFDGLIQPISFETFWSRKTVNIDRINIKNSSFNEFVFFVSTPLCNQNEEPITFKILNSNFFNNQSGLVIDNAGIAGIQYELNNLVFQENYVKGNDPSLGILSINIASPFVSKNLIIGNIAFLNNKANETTIGLSLSGSSENIPGKSIFHPQGERPVFDYSIDPRLPSLQSPSKDLKDWPLEACFFSNISHQQNLIFVPNTTKCSASAIIDTAGNSLSFTQEIINDTLQLSYSGGIANQLIASNGMIIQLPEPTIFNVDSIIPPALAEEPEQQIDTLLEEPESVFKPSFEIGAMGGLAFYVGDIKHRFGVPGTYEWSGGFFLQYNRKESWSYRATYYRTNVGMHDPTAPIQIFQSAPTYVTRNKVISQRSSWENNFRTQMYIIDFDAIYYFAPKHNLLQAFNDDGIGHWVPAVGLGVGFMKFDPYKNLVYHRSKDSAVFMALRPLGMEGQNFLSGKKDYGNYTMNLNISIQLAYIYKRFRIRYELKTVLTMTDYLDDYGQGFTYGGNYAKWKAANADIEMPVDKRTGKQIPLEKVFPVYNSSIKRTQNLLPDMYFQQHIGISYDLGSLFIRKSKR